MKSKKYYFLRQNHESLVKKLMQDPKSFWRKLVVTFAKPSLDPGSLLVFAKKLCFFLKANSFPKCKAIPGLFSKE